MNISDYFICVKKIKKQPNIKTHNSLTNENKTTNNQTLTSPNKEQRQYSIKYYSSY